MSETVYNGSKSLVGLGNIGIVTTTPDAYLTVGDGTVNAQAPLRVYHNYNNGPTVILQNQSTGTGAYTGLQIGEASNGNRGGLAVFGNNYTASAQYRTSGTYLYNNASGGGITIHAEAANSNVYIATAGSERMRITSAGNVGIGITNPSSQFIVQNNVNQAAALQVALWSNYAGTGALSAFYDPGNANNNTGYSVTAAIQYLSKNNTSGRSINAAGTVNASGADYAEYMTKSGDFTIQKGDLVGVNAQGLLTNVFVDSVSFVVKSTDPCMVGGDVWGSEEALGLTKPKESDPAFAQFSAKLEEARARVDRVAFAGQVPVNVLGATPGQYVVPVANKDGSITGQAVSNPSFEQYRSAVGRVIKILPDGRAWIIVKVV